MHTFIYFYQPPNVSLVFSAKHLIMNIIKHMKMLDEFYDDTHSPTIYIFFKFLD